ncbi:hypothetical protein DTO280E4_8788 [Paecilomyces variotii]|nr:hypothetical protein DTO280E4_8788 [Paecilomyces variotii]
MYIFAGSGIKDNAYGVSCGSSDRLGVDRRGTSSLCDYTGVNCRRVKGAPSRDGEKTDGNSDSSSHDAWISHALTGQFEIER